MKKIIIIAVAVVAAAIAGVWYYANRGFGGDTPQRVYVPAGSTVESVGDSLRSALGENYGSKVYAIWKQLGGDPTISHGSYLVEPGEKAYAVANRIAKGRQTPVKVVVNVARTLDDLTAAIASRIEAAPSEILLAMDSVLASDSEYSDRRRYTAAILPDTYEFYWTASPRKVVEALVRWRDKFWTEERLAKAKSLGLTPSQVVTLASIVEEESNKSDEHPVIARLYLNRLAKGMKLQADPTVKFALGDFGLRRVTSAHLAVESSYNTYKNTGLPPGPIRVPQKSTIDAVLNPADNSYLYMCAKEDFSGYHNFTSDYNTHLANARRYAAALNCQGIY